MIGWSVLSNDLLDYVHFRAVCTYWRSATPCPRGHGLYPGHGKLHGYVRFFNLSTGAFARVHLDPFFKNHCVLDSVDGVLLLQRDEDTAVRLLHPFTGDVAEFSPLSTLLPFVPLHLDAETEAGKWRYLRRVLAASISVGADGTVSVMMMLHEVTRVAFAKSGDEQWRVSMWECDRYYMPMAFQGKIYAMNRPIPGGDDISVFQIDPPQMVSGSFRPPPPPKLITTFEVPGCYQLVECDSEILVMMATRNLTSSPTQFSVYRLADLVQGRVAPVTSVGGNAIFYASRSSSVSCNAFPAIVGDTVVFYDGTKNFCPVHYHLGGGTWSKAAEGWSGANIVPSPCTIIHHIFTLLLPCAVVSWCFVFVFPAIYIYIYIYIWKIYSTLKCSYSHVQKLFHIYTLLKEVNTSKRCCTVLYKVSKLVRIAIKSLVLAWSVLS
ncbi:hypothetical protein PR202_ga21233 [Eleusine coracana subsp. coracana]|uniref:KIB1-4 beta-propeller domain-containing protein n=1 Tax=Eleusine coracana subsp. coracana TaxID=191504 RepID=A0AAV5D0D9_ELECO|nr:hypothetical protein PR202_ga21233 [Eleusine coracana subsp. coracana]